MHGHQTPTRNLKINGAFVSISLGVFSMMSQRIAEPLAITAPAVFLFFCSQHSRSKPRGCDQFLGGDSWSVGWKGNGHQNESHGADWEEPTTAPNLWVVWYIITWYLHGIETWWNLKNTKINVQVCPSPSFYKFYGHRSEDDWSVTHETKGYYKGYMIYMLCMDIRSPVLRPYFWTQEGNGCLQNWIPKTCSSKCSMP